MTETVLFLHGPMTRDTRIFLSGLTDFAASCGWKILQAVPPPKAGAAYLARLIDFWHPLGIVETCAHDKHMPMPTTKMTTPFVFINLDESLRRGGAAETCPHRGFVDCDSPALAEIAAKMLLERKLASYAYVSAYERYHWCAARQRRFRDCVALTGCACFSFDGTGLAAGTAAILRRLRKWLRNLPKPCGLLAANDRTAALVLDAAALEGVTVPDEINVVGIDDDAELCEAMSPPLTSVKMDFVSGGRLAGEALRTVREKSRKRALQVFYGPKHVVHRLSTREIARTSPGIRTALEVIRRQATSGISARDILPILGGSRRAAEKRFRASVGKSILEEILDVRFERLLTVLESENVQLNTLAGRLGFSSENHLQRQFKARYGMTISAYRDTNTRHHLRVTGQTRR